MSDTVQLILQAGALGLLLVVLAGIFYGLKAFVPPMSQFLLGLVASLRELQGGQISIVSEVKSLDTRIHARVDVLETRISAHNERMAESVADEVRSRASKADDAVTALTAEVAEIRRHGTNPSMPALGGSYGPAPTPPHGFPPILPRPPSSSGWNSSQGAEQSYSNGQGPRRPS